jgi:hypothetical protein
LHERSGVNGSFGVHPKEVWRYLGEELGVLSPFLMVGMGVAAIALGLTRSTEARVKHLLTQFVPLQALFFFFSLNKAGQPNWIAPSLITGIILLVVYWQEIWRSKSQWRWMIRLALGVATVMTIAMHLMPFLSLPRQLNPLRRAEGWPDFTWHVQQARLKYQADVLTGDHYSLASLMQFYLPDRPTTYLPPDTYGSTQFTLWPPYLVKSGMRALYVTDSGKADPLPKLLRNQFDECTLADDFWSKHRGQPIDRFRIYLLTKN